MTDLTFDTTCCSQVIAGHCFDNGYGEKLPVFWKEYYAVYWNINTCKDRCPEIILKIALKHHTHSHFNPLPDDKIIESSKLKQIADDILKCI